MNWPSPRLYILLFCRKSKGRPRQAITRQLHSHPKLQLQAVSDHTSNPSGSLIPHSGPATHIKLAYGVPWSRSILANQFQVTCSHSQACINQPVTPVIRGSNRNFKPLSNPYMRTFAKLV